MVGQEYVWLVITTDEEKHLFSTKEVVISRKTFTNKVDALKFCNAQKAKGYTSKISKWFGD